MEVKQLIKKLINRETIQYLIFGILTTILNIGTYMILSQYIGIDAAISNILAWIVGVIFAYITNRLWVFESKVSGYDNILKEIGQFIAARLATGVMDEIIVVAGAYILAGSSYEVIGNLIVKIGSNVLVVILNYIFSKLLVFRKDKT